MVLISTLEKSTGGGGAAAGCCAKTGADNAIMVAATAILPLSISPPCGDFSDVLAHDCIAADSGSKGSADGRRSRRAICYLDNRCATNATDAASKRKPGS